MADLMDVFEMKWVQMHYMNLLAMDKPYDDYKDGGVIKNLKKFDRQGKAIQLELKRF